VGPAPSPFVIVKEKPRLNPEFSAWMMALEPPLLSRRAALRCIGNAVNPLQALAAFSSLLNVEVAL
jgi:hypothetical protein